MAIDLSRLLQDSPELADRLLEAASSAADNAGERLNRATRDLSINPRLLMAGGVIVGFAAAGVYFGARYWRQQQLDRLRAERRELELDLEREAQRLDAADDMPVLDAEPDDGLIADGRDLGELEQAAWLAGASPGSNPDLTNGPRSQGSSVLEAELEDRNSALAEDRIARSDP